MLSFSQRDEMSKLELEYQRHEQYTRGLQNTLRAEQDKQRLMWRDMNTDMVFSL